MANLFATEQLHHYSSSQPIPLCVCVHQWRLKISRKLWQTAGQGSGDRSKKGKDRIFSGFTPTTKKSLTSHTEMALTWCEHVRIRFQPPFFPLRSPPRNSPNLLSRCIPHARNRMWVNASSVVDMSLLATDASTPQLLLGYIGVWWLILQRDSKVSHHWWLCTLITTVKEFTIMGPLTRFTTEPPPPTHITITSFVSVKVSPSLPFVQSLHLEETWGEWGGSQTQDTTQVVFFLI